MQKLFCPFLIVLSLVSCSQDENLPEKNTIAAGTARKNYRELPEVYPANKNNIYDITGSLYYRISENYLNTIQATQSIADIILNVEILANADNAFLMLKPGDYRSPSVTEISFLADPSITAVEKIDRLPVSGYAKNALLGFSEKLLLFHREKEQVMTIHRFIVDFETAVLADNGFSNLDRQVILSSTSVARYAVHFANTHRKRKPRDRDWEISYSCIIATALGGGRNTCEAITASVVAAMLQNVEY